MSAREHRHSVAPAALCTVVALLCVAAGQAIGQGAGTPSTAQAAQADSPASEAGQQAAPAPAPPQAESGPPADLDAQLRDIREPVAYPVRWRTGRIALALALLIALSATLTALAIRALRGRTQRPVVPAPAPARASDSAVRRLEELQATGLWEQRHNGVFADRFSAILRDFTAETLAPRSEAATTDELGRRLERDGLGARATELQALLSSCDIEKFARHDAFHESPIGHAIRWVRSVDAAHGDGGRE